MRRPGATARSAIGRSTRSTGTPVSGSDASTAGPIEEQVTRMWEAPAASAEPMWPATRRAVSGVRRPAAMVFLIRLSSTMLNVSTPGRCLAHSSANTGTSVAEVWTSPSVAVKAAPSGGG
jgi:hypothetical protein